MAQINIDVADKTTLDQIKSLIENLGSGSGGGLICNPSFSTSSVALGQTTKIGNANWQCNKWLYYKGYLYGYNYSDEDEPYGFVRYDGTNMTYSFSNSTDDLPNIPIYQNTGTQRDTFVFGDKVVCMNSTSYYTWDGSATSWTKKSVFRFPHYTTNKNIYNYGITVFNNEIHIIGGYNYSDSVYLNQHYKYNGSSWTLVSTLPHASSVGCAFVYQNELHAMLELSEGDSPYGHYKFADGKWEYVSNKVFSQSMTGIVEHNGALHALANKTHYKFVNGVWSTIETISDTYAKTLLIYNNQLVSIGQYMYSLTEGSVYKNSLLLPKGAKIMLDIALDCVVPITNCRIADNYIETLENGYVEFHIDRAYYDKTFSLYTIFK